eukprot:4204064-Pyramimonas_sp.AAC.1
MHVSTDCGLPWLEAVIQVCAFWHDHVAVNSSSIRRRTWNEWCDQAMESGARRAHGYLKEKITPQKFQFKGMAEQALDVCSVEQRMREERLKWSTAWGCCDGPRNIPTCGAHPVPVPELPSAEKSRGISNRFKPNTCQRDGWYPRHYSLLGEDTSAVFGKLLLRMEMRGRNPSS